MMRTTPIRRSLGRTLTGIAAIAFGLAVLAWYVIDAQRQADERERERRRETEQQHQLVPAPASGPVTADGLFPSSKFIAIPPAGNGGRAAAGAPIDEKALMFSSKSAAVPVPAEQPKR